MTFRSPLLQTYPTHRNTDQLLITRKRAFFVAMVGFVIACPILLVVFRLPEVDGWGRSLYWLHDHVYLPLKGYLYTLFFPISLVWLVLATVLLLSWLFFFVNNQSMLRPLHVFLLKHTLKPAPWRGLLLQAAEHMSERAGVTPRLMAEVTDYLRSRELDRLTAGKPTPMQITSFTKLCVFQLKLLLIPGDPSAPLRAALAFVESFPLIKTHLQQKDESAFADFCRLAAVFAHRLADADRLNQSQRAFDPDSFALDVLYLAVLGEPALTKQLPGSPRGDLPRAQLEHHTAYRLSSTMNARRKVLDGLRLSLEERHLRFREMPQLTRSNPFAAFEADDLESWGRLTLELVLVRAWLDDHPEPALIFSESLEALQLALSLSPSDAQPAERAICRSCRTFLGRLPLPRHFHRLAGLNDGLLQERREHYRRSNLERSGYILPTDFTPAMDRVLDLTRATGPDLGGEAT